MPSLGFYKKISQKNKSRIQLKTYNTIHNTVKQKADHLRYGTWSCLKKIDKSFFSKN